MNRVAIKEKLVFVDTVILVLFPSLWRVVISLVEATSGSKGRPIENHFVININCGGSLEEKFPNIKNLELLKGAEITSSK